MKFSDIRDLNKADILSAIGLASKRSASAQILSGVSLFGVGLLVGAGAALLFAPKTGEDMRQDLGQRLRKLREEQFDSGDLSALGVSSRDEVRT